MCICMPIHIYSTFMHTYRHVYMCMYVYMCICKPIPPTKFMKHISSMRKPEFKNYLQV